MLSNIASVTLGIGVVDVGDYDTSSPLHVDNFATAAIAEPETCAMLIAGIGLMGAIALRMARAVDGCGR